MTDFDNVKILHADKFLSGGHCNLLGEDLSLEKGYKINFDEATVKFISEMVNLRRMILSDFEFDIFKNAKGMIEYAIFYSSRDSTGFTMMHPIRLSEAEADAVMQEIKNCRNFNHKIAKEIPEKK